jgi:pseudouridine-5'-phosphate glycosidase
VTRHLSPFMAIAPHVHRALVRGEPVVALESCLIAHGFPSPEGVAVALAAEEQVRANGALPATVAVLDGTVRVGLDVEEIRRLAEPDVRKVGPRDLAACAVSGRAGATTVAGTLAACRIAGIHFLGTGGIGGVHRGWSSTLDISADVHELAQVPVCIVCSGVKSLLDIPATLEMLESLGVPVIGYGTDTLPLFLSRDGGPALTDRADDPETVATVAAAHWAFARTTGVVVAQPPAVEAAVPYADVQPIVERALREAEAGGSAGGAVTPRVLAAVHRESDGRTLAANRRLIEDNAALAARVAVAYYAS